MGNLIPQASRTPAEAREMGRKGGRVSGEVRREKRLISQIYGEVLEINTRSRQVKTLLQEKYPVKN